MEFGGREKWGSPEGFTEQIRSCGAGWVGGLVGGECSVGIATVQAAGCGCGPPVKKVKVRERHTLHEAGRLKAAASTVHSAATFIKPRSRNRRARCCSLTTPKTGSTNCCLRRYTSLTSSVAIQARWRRRITSPRLYGQATAFTSRLDTHSKGWVRPADGPGGLIKAVREPTGMPDADVGQRLPLGTRKEPVSEVKHEAEVRRSYLLCYRLHPHGDVSQLYIW